MVGKRVLITVGTTKFEKLIDTCTRKEVLDILQRLGYTSIQYQTGTGKCIEISHEILTLKFNKYLEEFDKEIKNADLVISHAGAGTCVQVLQKHKPLIVVINDDLMDNHQIELAEQLQNNKYLYYCHCGDLKKTLTNDFNKLKMYPVSQSGIFVDYLNKCMGFID